MASRSKRGQTGLQRGRRMRSRSVWQRGKWRFISGGMAGAIALLMVLSSSLSGPETTGGDSAPDLVLAATTGQQFRLSEQNGQPRLLYFSFPG